MIKNSLEPHLLLPKKWPRTIYSVEKWHKKLLSDCIYYEFKMKALGAGIANIKSQIKKYASSLKRGEFTNGCRLALSKLNNLLSRWEVELSVTKAIIKSMHQTNQFIIDSLLRAIGDAESVEKVAARHTGKRGNILHEPGWLAEYELSNLDKKKYASFITFGTSYDSAGFDIIKIPRPFRRIRLVQKHLSL